MKIKKNEYIAEIVGVKLANVYFSYTVYLLNTGLMLDLKQKNLDY